MNKRRPVFKWAQARDIGRMFDVYDVAQEQVAGFKQAQDYLKRMAFINAGLRRTAADFGNSVVDNEDSHQGLFVSEYLSVPNYLRVSVR